MAFPLGMPPFQFYSQGFHYWDPEGRNRTLDELPVLGFSPMYSSKSKEKNKYIVVDNPKIVP